MIFSARPLPDPAAGELRQVRRSLNKPVVSIAQLPAGPASAAIAVHETSGDGALHFTVAVRFERIRRVVFFSAEEVPNEEPPSLVNAAALSLAEGMGFLFDEWVETGSPATRELAQRLWGRFVEAAETSAAEERLSNVSDRADERGSPNIPLTKFRGDLPWSEAESAFADSES